MRRRCGGCIWRPSNGRRAPRRDVLASWPQDAVKVGLKHVRLMRRDGNCFYRALGLGYLQSLLRRCQQDPAAVATAKALHEDQRQLVGAFYQPIAYEDMWDVFAEAAEVAYAGTDDEALLAIFQDPIRSDWCVRGACRRRRRRASAWEPRSNR